MLIPNRHGNSPAYRYGFNGKEKDDEVKGEGLQYDYGFRIYDPRIGKFLSQDPLFKDYSWYTPYQFAGNKPIVAVDLDGLEERIVILYNTVEGNVSREVLDSKTLQKSTELVGVKHSQRFSPITGKEFSAVKKQMWDAFSSSPELFSSGYKSYTIGMNVKKYKNSGFTGLNQGTLTIASSTSGTNIIYDSDNVTRKKLPSIVQLIKQAPNNPEMAKGINTAKNFVAGVSLAVSGPALLAGNTTAIGYIGAAGDIDQLTGATATLTENAPSEVGTIINGFKLVASIISLKQNVLDFKNLGKLDCGLDASSKASEVIIDAAGTGADIDDFNNSLPKTD